MSHISTKKKLHKYHKIYVQIFEDPSIHLRQITKNTRIARSTASRYIEEMYELSIMKGPMIFVKPSQNYHHYVSFLKFKHPIAAYQGFEGFPTLLSRSLTVGCWNIMVISEKPMNLSLLKGLESSLLQDVKGVTHLSRVISLNWNESLEKMYSALTPPREKTTLYEEIFCNPWSTEERILYDKFRHNARAHVMSILKECGVRYERYQEWFSQLPQYTDMYTAFFPRGLDQYFVFDFLFKTEYQTQLADILGMLPSTSVFFSVKDHLFARVSLLSKQEKDQLFSFVYRLGEEGYFTDIYNASVIATSYW